MNARRSGIINSFYHQSHASFAQKTTRVPLLHYSCITRMSLVYPSCVTRVSLVYHSRDVHTLPLRSFTIFKTVSNSGVVFFTQDVKIQCRYLKDERRCHFDYGETFTRTYKHKYTKLFSQNQIPNTPQQLYSPFRSQIFLKKF